ncbi:MAG: methyltransferase domain-containing protein [Thermomicrobiales bacterium]|nr:methyltransferase domain-containing protein [Thermomicrobiales bacterium]
MSTLRPDVGSSLDSILASLSPDAYYQSPGGRRFLIAAAMLADIRRGSRVLDVGCGIGPAAVDMAEAFGCKVTGFDNFAPYLQFGRQLANGRGVGKQVSFKELDGDEPLSAFEPATFDVVLGLGGGVSDSLPGGLAAGLKAAADWLVPGGVLIAGDLISPVPPSELMRIVFGESLRSEAAYLTALTSSGFEVIFASRATRADWETMRSTMNRLRERSLDLGPSDEQSRSKLTEAAQDHPEIAYLNVVARKL